MRDQVSPTLRNAFIIFTIDIETAAEEKKIGLQAGGGVKSKPDDPFGVEQNFLGIVYILPLITSKDLDTETYPPISLKR